MVINDSEFDCAKSCLYICWKYCLKLGDIVLIKMCKKKEKGSLIM